MQLNEDDIWLSEALSSRRTYFEHSMSIIDFFNEVLVRELSFHAFVGQHASKR